MVKFTDVKEGDLMAVVHFVKVDKVSRVMDTVEVTDVDTGQEFSVRGIALVERMHSADSPSEECQITKTEMAEILSRSFNTPFTVFYEKQDGSERKLRGRLIKTEPLMGRVQVEDLDITSGNKFRLVDNRTLKELITGGVRYVLKKR